MGKVIQVVVYKSVSDEVKLAKYAELALTAVEAAEEDFFHVAFQLQLKRLANLIGLL